MSDVLAAEAAEEDSGLQAGDEGAADASSVADGMDDGSDDAGFDLEDLVSDLGLGPAGETDLEGALDAALDEDESSEDDDGDELGEAEDSADEEGEPEASGESEDEDAADDGDGDESGESGDAAQARIDELTRGAKEAEERATALEAELAQARADLEETRAKRAAPEGDGANAFSDVDTVEGLRKRRLKAVRQKQFLIRNRDGFTGKDADGNDVEFDADQVGESLASLEKQLDIDYPEREAFLAESRQYDEIGRQVYPDLYKPGTGWHKSYVATLGKLPGVANMPDGKLIVGDALVGRLARSGSYRLVPVEPEKPAAKRKAAEPKRKAKAPPVTARKSSLRGGPKRARRQAMTALESSSGGREDVEAVLEHMLG